MTKRCDGCVYWDELPGATEFKLARTRASDAGPVAVALGHCRIGPPEREGVTDRGKWPLTLADDFCHAHFPTEAPLEPYRHGPTNACLGPGGGS